MVENIRTELFLKQFGFNNTLLQEIFIKGLDPIKLFSVMNI